MWVPGTGNTDSGQYSVAVFPPPPPRRSQLWGGVLLLPFDFVKHANLFLKIYEKGQKIDQMLNRRTVLYVVTAILAKTISSIFRSALSLAVVKHYWIFRVWMYSTSMSVCVRVFIWALQPQKRCIDQQSALFLFVGWYSRLYCTVHSEFVVVVVFWFKNIKLKLIPELCTIK